jgi:hypothetical protein
VTLLLAALDEASRANELTRFLERCTSGTTDDAFYFANGSTAIAAHLVEKLAEAEGRGVDDVTAELGALIAASDAWPSRLGDSS